MSEQKVQIGEKVRSLREKKRMTIEEVAAATGIEADTLAGIEAQTVSPPLGSIITLAEALRVSVGDLLGDSADSPFCIVRSDGRKSVNRFSSAEGKGGGYRYESLGNKKQNRQMEPFLVTLTPVDEEGLAPNKHVGEEILFVLDGEVKVQLAEHTDILKQGDSIYYDSSLPHVVTCHGDRPATILAVIYARKEMMIL